MHIQDAQKKFVQSLHGEVSPQTVRWYRQRLTALADFLNGDIEAVTVDDLRRWRSWLLERDTLWQDHPSKPTINGRLSAQTIRGHIRAAKRFFAWLVEEGHLTTNPAGRLKPPPKPEEPPKAITTTDLNHLILAAKASSERDYALVLFLADTGCRVGGVVGLQLRDLDLTKCRALVREKGRGGGRKSRMVYFGAATCAALGEYLDKRPFVGMNDMVFVGRRGALGESGVYQLLQRLAEKAGINGRFNPHAFRHGWARGALENGADLGTVSQLLGHSSIAVTAEFYARWTNEELAARHRQFSWLNSAGDNEASAEQGTHKP